MEDLERKRMMDQITQGAFVRVPRLSQEEIEAYTRPRKRQAKKKYHFLSFDFLSDEEDDFFGISYPPAKKTRRARANSATASKISDDLPTPPLLDEEIPLLKRKNSDARKNSSSNIQRKNSNDDTKPVKVKKYSRSTSSKSKSSSDESKFTALDGLKPVITTEVKILKARKEEAPSYSVPSAADHKSSESKYPSETIKKSEPSQSKTPSPANSLIGKIRIKSAAELGSTVIFIDDDTPINKSTLSRNVSNASRNATSNRNSSSSNATSVSKSDSSSTQVRNSEINVELIGDLYAKLFTTKNQTKIRNVAEILQSIAENIKNNNERVQEITNNKDLTDAEKLMRRCLSFQDLKRKQEENEMKLKEKFEAIMAIFDNNNFELLFQLFFLGILKILIVSVSYFYKKGTIFKRLITLLQQSLTNSKFNDERVFKLLKSKDFRDRCITLVQFIERHCKTEFFSMLFLSDSDKNIIRTKNAPSNETSTEEKNASSTSSRYIKPELISVQERESFLLNLLKESKVVDSASSSVNCQQQQQQPSQQQQQQQQQQQHQQHHQQQQLQQQNFTWKTYAPASKRNGTSNSVAASNNSSKTNTANNSNGLVNSFIFSDGQIKPYPNNNVMNMQTNEPATSIRPVRPQNEVNHFLNRVASDPNNSVNPAYHMHTSYNMQMKVPHVNGLNGTYPLSTSNGNIENIQPDSYVNTNNIGKKVTKDTWNNGQINASGLRSLLVNDTPNDVRNNYQRFVDHYGASNVNLNNASRGPAITRNNGWMG